MLDYELYQALVRQANVERSKALGNFIFGALARVKHFFWRS